MNIHVLVSRRQTYVNFRYSVDDNSITPYGVCYQTRPLNRTKIWSAFIPTEMSCDSPKQGRAVSRSLITDNLMASGSPSRSGIPQYASGIPVNVIGTPLWHIVNDTGMETRADMWDGYVRVRVRVWMFVPLRNPYPRRAGHGYQPMNIKKIYTYFLLIVIHFVTYF
jgi:hypothetical protein